MPYADARAERLPLPGPKYLFGLRGPSGFGSGSTAAEVAREYAGRGRVVAITGGNAGLGAEAARVLASRGMTVVLFVRNTETATQLAERVRSATPEADVRVLRCDLGDLTSVAQAAQDFLALRLPLHVLMCNAGARCVCCRLGRCAAEGWRGAQMSRATLLHSAANVVHRAGVMVVPFGLTLQGIERHMGINHVGHALLARLLLPTMVHTAKEPGAPQGRVICLASMAHYLTYTGGLLPDAQVNSSKGYDVWKAYGQSKLANILFARELAARLAASGIPPNTLTAVSVHPGCILDTGLWQELKLSPVLTQVLRTLLRGTLWKSIPTGTATQVWAATTPGALPQGGYLQDCNVAGTSVAGLSTRLGSRLWAWTEPFLMPHVPKDIDAQQPFAWAEPPRPGSDPVGQGGANGGTQAPR